MLPHFILCKPVQTLKSSKLILGQTDEHKSSRECDHKTPMSMKGTNSQEKAKFKIFHCFWRQMANEKIIKSVNISS